MKNVPGRYRSQSRHWVGDGFPVRSPFSYEPLGARISPFLLLDYAGPHTFTPTPRRRGIGQHPHPGFETVTIVYDGEVEHRDSTGQGGIIGPARTFTPINVWDVCLNQGAAVILDLPRGHTSILVVLSGRILVNANEPAAEAEALLLDRAGDSVSISADTDTLPPASPASAGGLCRAIIGTI